MPHDTWQTFCKHYTEHLAEQPHSVIAFCEKTNEAVGFSLNEEFGTPPPPEVEHLFETTHEFGQVIEILSELEQPLLDYAGFESADSVPANTILHKWVMGVNKNFRKKGIATQMTEIVKNNSIKKGFQYIYSESTGYGSMTANTKNGFKVVHAVDYASWESKQTGMKTFAAIP